MRQNRKPILLYASLMGYFFLPGFTFGQNSYRYPASFGNYMTAYFLINPATELSGSKAQLSLGNQEYVGPLRRVRSYYLFAGLKLNKEERNTKSVAAIFVSNEKDGEYVSRSRLYFNYSWHTKVKENLWLGAGAYLGIINYSFESSPNTAGGSDFAPDGSLGIVLYNENLNIGFSGNQVFNSVLRPIIAEYKFPVYYNLNIHKSWEISPHVEVRPLSLITWKVKEKVWDLNAGVLSTFHNKVVLGANYKHQKVFSFLAGIKDIQVSKHFFNLNFSYNHPLGSLDVIQSMELSINYLYKL
jgi:hypothetical protein